MVYSKMINSCKILKPFSKSHIYINEGVSTKMKFKSTFLIVFLLFCISLIGCTQADKINGKQIGKELKNVLPKPDNILIYSNGNTKELGKDSSEYKKVVQLTEKRFHDNLSTVKDIIDDSTMNGIRKDGLGIEFLYNNQQELSIKGDGFQPFKYYKIYFQLTSQKYGNSQGSMVHTLQYGDKEHYKGCSRGPLKYSKELVRLVEGLE